MERWASFAVFNSERRWLVDQHPTSLFVAQRRRKNFVQELGMENDDGGALPFC
jgi:hypothetical protein